MKGRITKDGFEQSQLEFVDQHAKGKIQIHRDFIAHCFRWQYIVKHLAKSKKYEDVHLLDVGCGYDTPLYLVLASNRRAPKMYTGVDIGKIREPKYHSSAPRNFLSHTKATEIKTDDYDIITSFEMLEHVPVDYVEECLQHWYNLSPPHCELIVSTPVLDERVGMAKNHINEMSREQLMSLYAKTGWKVEKNYGTFASQKDYKKHLSESELELFEKLSEYHHVDVLSNFFAPLYPQYSRNNLWVCNKGEADGNGD